MYPVDLFLLTKTKPLNNEEFNKYIKSISKSKRELKVRDYERENLYQLVNLFINNDISTELMKGFYYSYSIYQICKEFDLIKISTDFVLNIEIKSEFTSFEKIKNQLLINSCYLKNIKSVVNAFTFIANTNTFYKLNHQLEIVEVDINDIKNILLASFQYINENLDEIISPSHYLVSPFNDIAKFMNNEYFLTNQQLQIKKEILKDVYELSQYKFYKIVGDAGTGKTLLIYDLAKELSKNKKICIVHSGILNQGHYKLRECLINCEIFSAKEFKNCNYSKYEIFIFDEIQRLYEYQFKDFIAYAKINDVKTIFSIGTDQIMQESEIKADINGKIDKLLDLNKFNLSDKIRTNINLSSFIKNIVNLNNVNKNADYDNIDVFYVSTKNETKDLVHYLNLMKYVYISFTTSIFKPHEIDDFISANNTHTVIGQEFDNVVMIMGQNFRYVDSRLHSPKHPNPNYIFSKLFYQGITRAREKLAIIVHRNPELYRTLIKIKQNNEEE